MRSGKSSMIILFDIDETLLIDSEYPTNKDTIRGLIADLIAQDYICGICTFRPFDVSVREVYSEYGLNGPIVTEGGACITYREGDKFVTNLYDKPKGFDLKDRVKNCLLEYVEKNNIDSEVVVSNDLFQEHAIIINAYRTAAPTIRIPKELEDKIPDIVDHLQDNPALDYLEIRVSHDNNLKIKMNPRYVNKIVAMERFFGNENIIFISDREKNLPMHNKNIRVYSVGEDKVFNEYCDKVFSPLGKGVEDILIMIKGEK